MATLHWCQDRDLFADSSVRRWLNSASRQKTRSMQQAGGLVTALVSVPDKFEDGDLELSLKRFKLCASASGWNEGKQLTYPPKFLRGRACCV